MGKRLNGYRKLWYNPLVTRDIYSLFRKSISRGLYNIRDTNDTTGRKAQMARNILVVEDDRNISDLIRMYLEKEGFEVRSAYDGGRGGAGAAGHPAHRRHAARKEKALEQLRHSAQ